MTEAPETSRVQPIFLGWDGPALPRAAKVIAEEYAGPDGLGSEGCGRGDPGGPGRASAGGASAGRGRGPRGSPDPSHAPSPSAGSRSSFIDHDRAPGRFHHLPPCLRQGAEDAGLRPAGCGLPPPPRQLVRLDGVGRDRGEPPPGAGGSGAGFPGCGIGSSGEDFPTTIPPAGRPWPGFRRPTSRCCGSRGSGTGTGNESRPWTKTGSPPPERSGWWGWWSFPGWSERWWRPFLDPFEP